MKKLAIISGAFSASLIALGSMCKIQHWFGGSILLVSGLVIFSILFVPSLAKYLYDKDN